ncbi:hypothetical protein IR166_30700, partial [Enterococcus faecalis]|nr:hypothetical protein [Enterococcus faecalis]
MPAPDGFSFLHADFAERVARRVERPLPGMGADPARGGGPPRRHGRRDPVALPAAAPDGGR